MDPPPSYDHGTKAGTVQISNDSKEQPPSYTGPSSLIAAASVATASDSAGTSWTPLEPEDCPTLTLDGCNIYSAAHPSRVLYVLSNPPAEAGTSAYGLEKVYYKTRDGQVKRSRQTHIYDLTVNFGIGSISGSSVVITGQRSSKFTFRSTLLTPTVPGTSNFKTSGADKGSNIRVSPVLTDARSKLAWKSEEGGKNLATEMKGTRDANNRMVVQPRLEVVQAGMEEKDFDFLVAAWCARVWKEGMKETKEPMSWDKFKRIASTKSSVHDIARMGGFL